MQICSFLHFTYFEALHLETHKITCKVGSNHRNMYGEVTVSLSLITYLSTIHEGEKYLPIDVKTWKSSPSTGKLITGEPLNYQAEGK